MDLALRERSDRALLVVGCLLHWIVARLPLCRDPDLWVFGARSGRAFADNAKYCFLHVAANHPEIRPVWLSKNETVVRDLRAADYEAYYTYSPRGLLANLCAGVVCVTHGLRDVNLPLSGGARAVLLWHGTPLKHISWDSHFPKESLPVRWAHAYAHRVLALVTVTAEVMVPVFASAFRIDPDVFAVTGYPRNDALFETILDADIGSDPGVEDLAADERVVLYLPTFRDVDESVLSTLDTAALTDLLERHDASLLVKPHPDEPIDLETLATDRIYALPETIDSHALLGLADVLVTDYSSILFDYLLLDRPLVFYAPDLDRYRARRGFYFDYDEVTPGPIAKTAPEFRAALEGVLGAEGDGFADERARVRDRFCYASSNRSAAVYDAIRDMVGKG